MRLHKSQIFLALLVSFLTGIFAAQFVNPQFGRILFLCVSIVAIVVTTLFWKRKLPVIVIGCLLSVVFGIWYFHAKSTIIDENHIASYNDSGTVKFSGVVMEEPDVRADRINLTVEAHLLVDLKTKTYGKVLVSAGRYPEYNYGDEVMVSGKLVTPFEDEEFSYKDYLAKDNIFSNVSFAKVEFLQANKASSIKAALLDFKQKFADNLSLVVAEPQNSLLLGLLVGARRSIPADLLDQFRITGVTHIIAISGFNISIITRLLGGFIQRTLGIKASMIISLLVVSGFVVITGAQASVVRAAIMGILVVVALNIGRSSVMFNVLILTAAVMVLFNPKILFFDVGFQLSFLATAGLLAFADKLEEVLYKVPKIFEIRTTLAATISAQIFVLPLLIYYFDEISIISLVVNVLILPIIPWAMFFGFVAGALALFFLPLSYLAAWIAWAFLTYQIKVVELFAKVPYAAVSIKNISIAWIFTYYLILCITAFIIYSRMREKRIWDFRHTK